MSQNYINTYHSSKWICNFSNIPTVTEIRDLSMYDRYVKSVIIPDYNMVETFSEFKGSRIRHPLSQKNDDLSALQIEFKIDESMHNYINLLEFMQELRYGQDVSDDFVRKNIIKSIDVTFLDNEKRSNKVIYFTNAFLINLSSISLMAGDDSEVSFTANFSYEEMKVKNSQ